MPRGKGTGDTDGPKNKAGQGSKLDGWRKRGAATDPADWTAVDGRLVVAAAAALGAEGGALRLGYTRDGGAYAVGVYLGDEHHTDYVKPSDDIDDYFRALVEEFGPRLL